MKHWRIIIAVAGLGLLGMPAFGADAPHHTQRASIPGPGTLNYVMGAVSCNGRMLPDNNVITLPDDIVTHYKLRAGQELTTGAGKAEILLTPGIFLRVGSNSAVKMISPDPAKIQVELERGRASVAVDRASLPNIVQIDDNGVTTQLMKTGYYEFNANHPEVMVFDGMAEVEVGAGKRQAVADHQELALVANGAPEMRVNFNSHPTNDALYNWSSQRSQSLAVANHQIAYGYDYVYMPTFKAGWKWDPWMEEYTFQGRHYDVSQFGTAFDPGIGPYGLLEGYY